MHVSYAVSFACILTAIPATADVPRVAADILPVHSLVAMIMGDLGTPDLILPPGASPHGYAMSPSQARAVQSADIIVTVGAGLTPWLDEATENLNADAQHVVLTEVDGAELLAYREELEFGSDGEGHQDVHAGHGGHDDHPEHAGHGEHEGRRDHADHDDDGHRHEHAGDANQEDHAGNAKQESHGTHGHHDAGGGHAGDQAHHEAEDEHDDHAGHHHGGSFDPHAWLDPANAAIWLSSLAGTLAQADPENAEIYRQNAADAQLQIADLASEISKQIAVVQDRPFMVFHDAYQYFENSFGIEAVASVIVTDSVGSGAARVARIRDLAGEAGVVCVFSEPQFPPGLVETIIEGTDIKRGTLDPLGAELRPGGELYATLLANMAEDFVTCLE